jgi:ornithine cyclodeaminase/alanine dehydrogenase-like protein (mu-crystallin family)
MQVVSAAEIDRVLTFPALIDALADAFRGDTVTPVRHHHEIERAGAHATLLLMPAWTGPAAQDGLQDGFLGIKVVSVFPDNGAKSLPSVMGSYLLMDGATGQPVAVLDGTRLTVWRTAAASALAARILAREDASRMVMVGAGSLAPFLIRAHMSQRPIREVALWNRNPQKAETLAAELQSQGLPVTAVTDLEAAVREADLVSCATLSTAPHRQRGLAEGGRASRSCRRLQSEDARGGRRGPAPGAGLCGYGGRQVRGRRCGGGPAPGRDHGRPCARHPGGSLPEPAP